MEAAENGLYIGLAEGQRVCMLPQMCCRHGLIAGASGTGKTITMKVMAERFSDIGVPTFLCDVKGDVSGICQPGVGSERMQGLIDRFGLAEGWQYRGFPTAFWDVFGQKGHPVRTTVSEMGPTMLSRILGLSPAQEGVLEIIFRVADDNDLELIDLKDLRAMVAYVGEHRSELTITYGNVTAQSLGGVTRAILPLENQGGALFFGEPPLDIRDWIRCDSNGKGLVNVLDCTSMIQSPTLYATFLLWLMAELFEALPEVGDTEKPKLVFFFDEAHLLFDEAPAALLQKIEQVVKLIRSKGVGIYFVTQNPADIPDGVLSQLQHRVQHALRAYTPDDQKGVRAAARSFRVNPAFDTETVIMELGVGEALVSFLDENGAPGIVQRTAICCPQSLMAPCDAAVRQQIMSGDSVGAKYDRAVDSDSAYEALQRLRQQREQTEALEKQQADLAKQQAELKKQQEKLAAQQQKAAEKEAAKREKEAERRKAKLETQLINSAGSAFRHVSRGLLKNLLK